MIQVDQHFKNVFIFLRKGIIGGLKGYEEPKSTGDWIIQARYTLAQLEPGELREVFAKPHEYIAYDHAACWIIALRQWNELLPDYIRTLNESSNPFFYVPLLAGLQLFEKEALEQYSGALELSEEKINQSILCFQIKNKLPLTENIGTSYLKKQIIRFYLFSEILSGGCSKDFFRKEMTNLLNETTSPQQVPLLHLPGEQRYATQKAISAQLQNGSIEELLKRAISSGDWQAILAVIESDLSYSLSSDSIVEAYEAVWKKVPTSYFLLEEYAVNLLLRGTKFDALAKVKMNEAERIKAKYEWKEVENFRYVHRRA